VKFIRKVLLVMIGVLLIGGSLSARTVEIWPGMSHIGKYKIMKNSYLYADKFNFVYIKDASGKEILYPIPTKLTRNYVKQNLYYIASQFYNINVKTYNNNIKGINQFYESFKDPVDPINLMKGLYCGIHKDKKYKNPNECYNEIKTSTVQNELFNNVFMVAAEILINAKKGVGDVASEAIGKTVLKKMIETPNNLLITQLFQGDGFWSNCLKYIFTKGVGVAADYLVEKSFAMTSKKALEEAVAKKLYGGFMGGLAFWAEVANGTGNITNTLNTIFKLNNGISNFEIKNYGYQFIKDYINKYNMDIDKMAKDCDLSLANNKYKIANISPNHTHPYNFFQLFVIYAVNHYKDISDIDLYSPKYMYQMWLEAHDVLRMIQYLGNGGNLKIYLDVDYITGSIKVNNKSYNLNALYWMLPMEIKNKVQNYYTNLIYTEPKSAFYTLLYAANTHFHNLNPFIQKYNYEYSWGYLFNNHKISNHKHINIILSKNALVETGLAQNKFRNIIYKFDVNKTINYNGFFTKSDYQVYKKKTTSQTVYIPRYFQVSKSNDILGKYISIGIIDISPNIYEQMFLSITQSKLKSIFIRYANLSSVFSKQEVINSFRNISWTSPIKRKQFFKFLVKLLKIDTTSQYSVNFSNVYSNIFIKNNGICYDTTLEGCALRTKGILTGNNPNGTLTLFQVLLTLDKIESTYKK